MNTLGIRGLDFAPLERRGSVYPFVFSCLPRQLVTNCRTGKADKALSFWFLLQWFAGDATNLVGALLTKQLLTQVTEQLLTRGGNRRIGAPIGLVDSIESFRNALSYLHLDYKKDFRGYISAYNVD